MLPFTTIVKYLTILTIVTDLTIQTIVIYLIKCYFSQLLGEYPHFKLWIFTLSTILFPHVKIEEKT